LNRIESWLIDMDGLLVREEPDQLDRREDRAGLADRRHPGWTDRGVTAP
jgi:hypothetical protein